MFSNILAVVAIQLLIRSVSSQNVTNEYLNHQCNNTQGRYTRGSTFEKNLNQVIHNISHLHLRNGYTYESNVVAYEVSKDPNIVFVLLQCRGDSYGSKCHSCLHTALSGLRERCPGNRGAIIWYDQCVLEISSVNTKGRIRYDSFFNMTNLKNVSSDAEQFKNKRKDLFDKLLVKATKDVSEKNGWYAVGETRIGRNKLYAMMQCALDLTPNGCYVCLEWITGRYDSYYFDRTQGGRVLGRSCSLRYEIYPFLRR
ncbi:unnamed protein product [Arabidopsis arenosa]|uniref:Gnk2-homologous domain-containing protein n=1 Tax=Arabidopsis arenosa TaxID=38785 RepID=A0A8S2A9L0_ARAAE|nr:unnamed protein product [Arabidopsis arenosa]